jgi:hypothetical protein
VPGADEHASATHEHAPAYGDENAGTDEYACPVGNAVSAGLLGTGQQVQVPLKMEEEHGKSNVEDF